MSSRRRGFVVALALATGLSLACSDQAIFQSPSGYFPLRDGLRWEYTMNWAIALLGNGSGRMVIRINGSEQIGDHMYFKSVTTVTGLPGAEDETNYYRLTDQGLYQVRSQHKTGGEFLAVPLPAKEGASWKVRAAGMDLSYSVEAIETVEISGGSFPKSLKLRFSGSVDGNSVEGYEQYAPGIGLLRGMQKYGNGAIEYSFEKPKS
jgi:hypothetical protein